jgi:hypothetical protein
LTSIYYPQHLRPVLSLGYTDKPRFTPTHNIHVLYIMNMARGEDRPRGQRTQVDRQTFFGLSLHLTGNTQLHRTLRRRITNGCSVSC